MIEAGSLGFFSTEAGRKRIEKIAKNGSASSEEVATLAKLFLAYLNEQKYIPIHTYYEVERKI